ncbi:MAG: hypothetical protein PHI97_31050 [Desulfobulbus sp.]|nr:hypothetical protein [Desulfobulbus sp.]
MKDQKEVYKSRDIILNSKAVVSFLRDMACSQHFKDELTDDGREGLAHILGLVNEDLGQAVGMLESH